MVAMFKRFMLGAWETLVRGLKSNYLKMIFAIGIILCISLAFSVSLKTGQKSIQELKYTSTERPVQSMVFVKRKNILNFITCIDDGKSGFCQIFANPAMHLSAAEYFSSHFEYSITGSAALISHDISRSSSYVISAYHVCDDFSRRTITIHVPAPVPHTLVFEYSPVVTLTDFFGNEYSAEEVRMDRSNDLCILGTTEIMDGIKPVRIASRLPSHGERIYNIASPHGLSRPGAVLSYEGYFAGNISGNRTIHDSHYLFAIPTAPGSSGSIILNSSGEIISVVSYGFITRSQGPLPPHEMWPNASAGPGLPAIQNLIMPRTIQ